MNRLNADRRSTLSAALEALPRVTLAALPTPLQALPGLTRELGGPEIWIKRDDLTGLATGGNKTRMFEFALGRAVRDGVNAVVAGAAVQSNYCRQLAAACAKLGIECHLTLRKVRGKRDEEVQGGLLLDLLVGAHVELVEDEGSWVELGKHIRENARRLEAQGKKVLVARVGDETGLGLDACGYALAALELIDQADDAGLNIDELWICSSDVSQAGLGLAFKHIEAPIRLVGVPALSEPVSPGWTFQECIAQVANECAELLGLETRLSPGEITSLLDYIGSGYAISTPEAREAMRLLGSRDGILLDPVYTSKAMAGLIDHIRRGVINPDRHIVFLHTGGLPALFAYTDTLQLEELL